MALAGVMVSGAIGAAQEETPQITVGERRAPRKKDAEPRALALLRLSPDGKSSLLPIAILINGKFWDASAYKASPVPMALDPGTVYEAERTGSSQGLFTISTALHSNAVNAPVPWIATGSWLPAGADTGKKTLQAETAPKGLEDSDAPPRLTKTPAASTGSATGSTASTNTAPATAPSSKPPAESGDEPPRLSKPASPPASPPASSMPAPASQPPTATAPPAESKPKDSPTASKPDATASGTAKPQTGKSETAKPVDVATPSDSGASEANRPRLRRGKPPESFADEDVPGYSKPGASPGSDHAASANGAKKPPAPDIGPVQLIPAISDSAGPDPHSYGFEWLKGEEADRRKQLIALAQDQVRAYVEERAKARIEPAASPKTAIHHASAKKSSPPVLTDVKMTSYDLWSTNVPVVVFSAQAHVPHVLSVKGVAEASADSLPVPTEDLQYSVLIVAYPDIYNNLHKLYVGVTDKYHLDLTPRLELVDAVDADGDGRGELLFSETSDAGSGWVIYRATADKLWKMYDSLNPE